MIVKSNQKMAYLFFGVLAFAFAEPIDAQILVANWDFTASAADTTGNEHNGILSSGATISSQGLDLDQTDDGEVQVASDMSLEPSSDGNEWVLELRGVQSDMADDGSFGAVYSSRDSDGLGTIIYRGNSGNWEFWTGNGEGGWNILNTGIFVDTSLTYNLTARIQNTLMTFTVDDGTTVQSFQLETSVFAPQSGSRPISFGNGGNSQGEFFFDGRIAGASIITSRLLGDVNIDGVVDFFDIAPFIAVLSSQGFQTEADIDQSGDVNFFDIAPFIDILSSQ